MQEFTVQDRRTLSLCPLFRGLELDVLLPQLDGCCHDIQQGQFLIHEGEVMERVWIVLGGVLHAARLDVSGREFLYQQLLPSCLAGGEVSCTKRKTSPYSIYASSDSRLWSFSWSLVEDGKLSTELTLALVRNMLAFVSSQNIRKYYKIEALSVKGARERILKYLTAQATRTQSCNFYISMDREELASYLCINRSVLSHELKKMEKEGLLRFRKNHFILLGECCPPHLQQS